VQKKGPPKRALVAASKVTTRSVGALSPGSCFAAWSEVCCSGDWLFPEPAYLDLHPELSCPELWFRGCSELFPEWGRSAWSAESAYSSCPELFPASHYPESELQCPALGPRFPESVQPFPEWLLQAASCRALSVPALFDRPLLCQRPPIQPSRRSGAQPSGPELHWFDGFAHSA
jgi:hypothetical protein